jgi:hypothetical protein
MVIWFNSASTHPFCAIVVCCCAVPGTDRDETTTATSIEQQRA